MLFPKKIIYELYIFVWIQQKTEYCFGNNHFYSCKSRLSFGSVVRRLASQNEGGKFKQTNVDFVHVITKEPLQRAVYLTVIL